MERKLKFGVLGGWRGVSVAWGAQANGYDTLEVFEACPERWPTGPVPATTRVLCDAETGSL